MIQSPNDDPTTVGAYPFADAADTSSQTHGPLDGIRVLDISTVYAAPITAMLLGDFGADVIKVEHPTGDPARSHGANKAGHGLWWKVISRNKRCVTLKLSTREGQQILRDLVADADVLVENFRPGVLEKWGLGPEQLHAVNPGLVMLRVTGFGQAGPYAGRRAFGTLAEAMSGFAHQTGEEDGPPTLPPFGLADGVTGITGAFAVLTALYHRASPEGAGRGQVIDLSLLEPLLGILGPGPTAFDQLGAVPGRHGNRSPNNAPRNAYLTKDDRWVAVSASATSVAERVMRLVGRPDIIEQPWFASAGERSRNGDLLDEAVAKWIADRPLTEVTEQFERIGAALAPIYDVEQLMNDPQVIARETITTVDDEDLGPVKMQNLMFRMLGTPGSIRFAGRRLGQDNEQFYRAALGFDTEQLAALEGKGSVVVDRSYLFAPGHSEKLLGKVFDAGADAVILDLEDAVPPEHKALARHRVAGTLWHHPAWVRINAAQTPLAEADLHAVAAVAYGIRIPKVESVDDVRWVPDRAPGKPLICAIESAKGVANAFAIATEPAVRHLALGGIDLQKDLGVASGDAPLQYVRSHLVVASRAAGLKPPIDSVPVPSRHRRTSKASRAQPLARVLRQVRDPPLSTAAHPRRVQPRRRRTAMGADGP